MIIIFEIGEAIKKEKNILSERRDERVFEHQTKDARTKLDYSQFTCDIEEIIREKLNDRSIYVTEVQFSDAKMFIDYKCLDQDGYVIFNGRDERSGYRFQQVGSFSMFFQDMGYQNLQVPYTSLYGNNTMKKLLIEIIHDRMSDEFEVYEDRDYDTGALYIALKRIGEVPVRPQNLRTII